MAKKDVLKGRSIVNKKIFIRNESEDIIDKLTKEHEYLEEKSKKHLLT